MNIDQLTINAIRMLSVEGVQKANSGHPACHLEQPLWPMPFGLNR